MLRQKSIIMKIKVIILLSFTLFVSCSECPTNYKTIITNLYTSSSTDSINQVLQTNNMAMKIATTENAEIDTLYIDKYVIIENRTGYCIWAITNTTDYYWIDVPEYLVGYSIGFIYDKKHLTLYQTEKFDLECTGLFHVLHETCTFDDCTIDVRYEDESVEKVHFFKCASDTIRL